MQEKLILWQTIFMGLQALIMLVTGFFVVWYTWETQLLRKETHRQADLLSQSMQEEKAAKIRASKPFLRWTNGSGGDDFWKRNLANAGADIFDLSIETIPTITAEIRPQDCLRNNEEGHIRLSDPNFRAISEVTFKIYYTTVLGYRECKCYKLDSNRAIKMESAT